MNAPLLFINSPTYVLDDASQYKYDSRITKAISFSPFEKQLKDLSTIYENGARIYIELATKEKIYSGVVTNYINNHVSLKDNVETYIISINDIERLNIIKIS